MDDFEAIAGGYRRRLPLSTRENLQISLHGEAIRSETQVHYELLHVQPRRDVTRLAIDFHGQGLVHQGLLMDGDQFFLAFK